MGGALRWVESPVVPDQVVVRIPGATRHVAVVRATATSLAALQDFTYDRVTDLHIAIDEVCSRILATSSPSAGRLEVTFTLEEDGLRVRARGDAPLKDGAEFLTSWSRAILDTITGGVEVAASGDGPAEASFFVEKG
jgi:serine/threonine-protein kinase RsbW